MRRQLGFNLIEVMIALVVISIGLLGMAILQMTSLQQNQSAYYRSQATLLAYDVVDRMRANMDQVSAGNYFAVSGAINNNCINYSGSASGCTSAQMASNDIAEWQAVLATELPQGGGRVCRGTTTGGAVGAPACNAGFTATNSPIHVFVWWNDDKNVSGATTQFSVSVEL